MTLECSGGRAVTVTRECAVTLECSGGRAVTVTRECAAPQLGSAPRQAMEPAPRSPRRRHGAAAWRRGAGISQESLP